MPAALRGVEGPRARDCEVSGQEIIAVEIQGISYLAAIRPLCSMTAFGNTGHLLA
jgi:hypothetical protein